MTKSKTIAVKQKLEAGVRRLFAGSEALAFGYGGNSVVSRATSLSVKTVRRRVKECKAIEEDQAPQLKPTRRRWFGGGRKKMTEKHPELMAVLNKLVEGTTRGAPEFPLLWMARSQRNLVEALK